MKKISEKLFGAYHAFRAWSGCHYSPRPLTSITDEGAWLKQTVPSLSQNLFNHLNTDMKTYKLSSYLLILICLLFNYLGSWAQVQTIQNNTTSITITPENITTKRLSNDLNSNNISIGANALLNNTDNSQVGSGNTAIGISTLQDNTIGFSASLAPRPYGIFNTAVGYQTLYSNRGGNWNTAIGTFAMFFGQNSSGNTAIGYNAGNNIRNHSNVAVGFNTLASGYFGNRNTAIGYEAGQNMGIVIDNGLDSASVFLGYQAGRGTYNRTNKLFISNSNTPDPLIWGDFNTKFMTVHGRLGIDTKSPGQKLQIDDGGIRLRNNADNKNWEWNYDQTGKYAYFDELGVGRKLYLRNGPNPLVGIGINPTYNLHIRSNTSQTQMVIDNAGGGMFFTAKIDEGIINQTGGRFSLRTSDLERLTIFPSSNRLAINPPLNTASTAYSLDVYDGFSLINSSIRIRPSAWQTNSEALLALGDGNHFIKGTHTVGMQIHDANKIKITGSNVSIGNLDPDAKLLVDGYTKLGSDAPKIKNKYYEESAAMPTILRTANTQGGVSFYDLGINSPRILAVNIFVDYGSVPLTATKTDDFVPPSYTATNGYQFDYVLNGSIIEIKNHPSNSSNILGKYVRIFITYRE